MAGAFALGIRRAFATAFAASGLIAMLAAPAEALPPSLQTAGAANGLITSTWTLPSGVRSEFFEVAKYPDVNVYGYFRQKLVRPGDPLDGEESQVRFGVLAGDQTSLAPGDPTPPLPDGVYYVHIAGHDSVYDACPQIEFSDMWEVTIQGGAAVSSTPHAPGTGNCTLRKARPASGGGSGGGSGGSVVPGDKTPPTTQLRYRRKQDIDRLLVRARMSEPGMLTVKALVDTGGLLARVYTFRQAKRKVTGGVVARLRLKLSKKNKRALKRVMRKRARRAKGKRRLKPLRARITLTAIDRAGNTTTKHAVIRLKR